MRLLIKFLKGLVALVVVVAIYLAFVGFGPGFEIAVPEIKTERSVVSLSQPPPGRSEVSFDVEGNRVSGFVYLPADAPGPRPGIVMAHGFGGTKNFIVEDYALKFQNVGFVVLTFDYRFFGSSAGEPRQLIWNSHQLEDVDAAVMYMKGRSEVDGEHIALWGTSMGGAHAFMSAARNRNVAAVVVQVPALDPTIESEGEDQSPGDLVRLIIHGQRDLVRMRLNLEPHRIPIFGPPGSLAILNSPEAWETYKTLAPEGYVNRVCARIILRGFSYRPVEYAEQIEVPILIQIADRDEVVSPRSADAAIAKLGSLAEVLHYDASHFEIYKGRHFDQASADQLTFLQRHLHSEE